MIYDQQCRSTFLHVFCLIFFRTHLRKKCGHCDRFCQYYLVWILRSGWQDSSLEEIRISFPFLHNSNMRSCEESPWRDLNVVLLWGIEDFLFLVFYKVRCLLYLFRVSLCVLSGVNYRLRSRFSRSFFIISLLLEQAWLLGLSKGSTLSLMS